MHSNDLNRFAKKIKTITQNCGELGNQQTIVVFEKCEICHWWIRSLLNEIFFFFLFDTFILTATRQVVKSDL